MGRGLGMSGAYTTVKIYGGDIVVQSSELNKGTTIEIIFPISTEEEVKIVRERVSIQGRALNVFWVDDDTAITENVSELVDSFGNKCSIANNGIDALEFLNNNVCDIVFTDIGMPGMPGMNGWELADAIRNQFGKEIKIVVVSGWSITEKDKEEHVIDSVLQKPFLLKDLEERLQMV